MSSSTEESGPISGATVHKRGERQEVRNSYRRALLAEKAALVEVRVHRKKRIELI